MMSFADFCAMMPVRPVDANGFVDDFGESVDYASVRERFEQQIQPGDTIYYYCSGQAEWEMMGSEGYLLVRSGEIVESYTRRMN